MSPARNSSLWDRISASAGGSRRVGIKVCVQRINSSIKFPNYFPWRNYQRHGQVKLAEQQAEPSMVGLEQMRIIGNEQDAVQHCRFGNNEGVVDLRSRQQPGEQDPPRRLAGDGFLGGIQVGRMEMPAGTQ